MTLSKKNMIALKACFHKAICDVNDQYPDMIVSVLSKIEVSMPSSKRPNRVDAHGVIVIKHTCNSVQFADDSQTRMIDRGAMCRDMHNVDHTQVGVIHGIARYHSLYIWITYILKTYDRSLTQKQTIMHKDYVYGIMTKAGISVVGNAYDQLFILHKKRDVPLAASIAPSIPIFGAVPSSLTQTRASTRKWSDLEISQFKEGVIIHGRDWVSIAKFFVTTRTRQQLCKYARINKAKYPELEGVPPGEQGWKKRFVAKCVFDSLTQAKVSL